MKLDLKTVENIATLARLQLEPSELESLQTQLTEILTHVEDLGELDTSNVPPTAHVEAQGTPLREDVPHEPMPVDDILRNAPDRKGTAFRVPRIIE